MTDDEIIKEYEEMLKRWGNELPDPLHEPKRFAWYVKLHRYYKMRDEKEL